MEFLAFLQLMVLGLIALVLIAIGEQLTDIVELMQR